MAVIKPVSKVISQDNGLVTDSESTGTLLVHTQSVSHGLATSEITDTFVHVHSDRDNDARTEPVQSVELLPSDQDTAATDATDHLLFFPPSMPGSVLTGWAAAVETETPRSIEEGSQTKLSRLTDTTTTGWLPMLSWLYMQTISSLVSNYTYTPPIEHSLNYGSSTLAM